MLDVGAQLLGETEELAARSARLIARPLHTGGALGDARNGLADLLRGSGLHLRGLRDLLERARGLGGDAGDLLESVLRLRLVAESEAPEEPFGAGFERVFSERIDEADRFYDEIMGPYLNADERRVARQAAAGPTRPL